MSNRCDRSIHQINRYNQTFKIFLQQHCEYIWGDSLYMRVVDIEKFNNQQMIVII